MTHSDSSTLLIAADGDSIAAAVLNALNHPTPWERERAIEEAARSADPDVLVRAVGDQHDAIRRNAAMDALIRGGRRSVPALVRALDDPDPELVMFAANLLGKTRDRAAVPHLLALLRFEDINVVQAAVESLGYLRATAAVDAIVPLLGDDPWLRCGAIHALGEIGDPRAVRPLGEILDDAESWELVVTALGKIRSLDAIEHLARAVWSTIEGPGLAIAVRCLGAALVRQPAPDPLWKLPSWARLASPEAARLHVRLGELLDEAAGGDDALAVGEATAMVIRMLGVDELYHPLVRAGRQRALSAAARFCTLAVGHDAADAIARAMGDGDQAVREFACRCAGAMRLDALAAPLVEALHDRADGVREAAVRALAHVGSRRAAPQLAARLLDTSPAVRLAAQEALGYCEPGAASEALLSFPNRDPAVAAAMLGVMRASPHPDQLPFLIDGLRHPSADLRVLAVEAIAEQPELDLVDLFAPMLDDDAPAVRFATLRAIGRHRTARVEQLLIERLCRDEVAAPMIVELLIAIAQRTIVPRLLELYPSCPPTARLPILEALATLREPAAEPLVIALLADPDPEVRRRAVKAAARFDDAVAFRHVIAAGTDPAWQVRATVAELLAEVDDELATDELERLALDEHPFVATTARHKLEATRG